MENSLQPKKSKKKLIYIVLSIIVGLCVLGVAVFYFYPIPENLKKTAIASNLERCIYMTGVRYKGTFELESFRGGIFSTLVYDAEGKQICSSGGYSNKPLEELCKAEICFSIYDN